MEKHKEICSHCLIKIQRYGGNTFQILQIGVNLKEEITVACQWGCKCCVMCNLSETVSWQKWQGFAFTGADQPWTGEIQILHLSVISRADATPGDWCNNSWLGCKISVLFSRKCARNIFTFWKCCRCQQAWLLLKIKCVASTVYRTCDSWSISLKGVPCVKDKNKSVA